MQHSPLIVAHRGASHDAPENTLPAFAEAWAQAADAIELDVRLTRDGHAVCCHDPTCLRTAGVDRAVDAMTLAEIATLDAGAWKSPRFIRTRVPTFAEVLRTLPPDKLCFVEIKDGVGTLDAVSRDLAAQSNVAREQLRVISFDADVIAAAKRALPDVPAFWLTAIRRDGGEPRPTLDAVLATLARCGADGLNAQADAAALDAPFVAALARRGLPLHVWTVDDAALARAMTTLGVASLTTNRPRFVRDALQPDIEARDVR